MIESARPTTIRLSETSKAAVFSLLLLTLALVAGLLIRALDPPRMLAYVTWGTTPLVAVLIMLFGITDNGRTRAGRKLLGLHRLGLRLWWIAIFGTLAISALVEEIAWRGYLLSRVLHLGRNRAFAITRLVHAGWHLPLILLTALDHSGGNLLIILPLFVGTIVAAGFVYGDLRIATGSIWPASIAHGAHNASAAALAALAVTSSPALLNEYLAGETGAFILMTTIVAAFWLRRWLRHHPGKEPGTR